MYVPKIARGNPNILVGSGPPSFGKNNTLRNILPAENNLIKLQLLDVQKRIKQNKCTMNSTFQTLEETFLSYHIILIKIFVLHT